MGISRETSLYLDLLRLVAVALVFLNHATRPDFSERFLRPLGVFGQEGVAIFFVLSEVIITPVATQRERDARSYTLARLSRLWSVAIPTILLTILLDVAGHWIAPSVYVSPGLPPPWAADWRPAWQALARHSSSMPCRPLRWRWAPTAPSGR